MESREEHSSTEEQNGQKPQYTTPMIGRLTFRQVWDLDERRAAEPERYSFAKVHSGGPCPCR